MLRAVLLVILIIEVVAATVWYFWGWLAAFFIGQAGLLGSIKTTLEILALLLGAVGVIWGWLRWSHTKVGLLDTGHGNEPIRSGADAEAAYRVWLAGRCEKISLGGLDLDADDARRGALKPWVWSRSMWIWIPSQPHPSKLSGMPSPLASL